MSDTYPPSPSHTTLVVGHPLPPTADTGADLMGVAVVVFALVVVAVLTVLTARLGPPR